MHAFHMCVCVCVSCPPKVMCDSFIRYANRYVHMGRHMQSNASHVAHVHARQSQPLSRVVHVSACALVCIYIYIHIYIYIWVNTRMKYKDYTHAHINTNVHTVSAQQALHPHPYTTCALAARNLSHPSERSHLRRYSTAATAGARPTRNTQNPARS
jgi:hypothetical protein